jgi:hypothetical protein
MGGADLRACRQVGQRQRHVDVVRHELQHAGVEAAHGVAQQAAQVGLPPACQSMEISMANQMVRQTDQKSHLLRI